jgi:hypothetical protein
MISVEQKDVNEGTQYVVHAGNAVDYKFCFFVDILVYFQVVGFRRDELQTMPPLAYQL